MREPQTVCVHFTQSRGRGRVCLCFLAWVRHCLPCLTWLHTADERGESLEARSLSEILFDSKRRSAEPHGGPAPPLWIELGWGGRAAQGSGQPLLSCNAHTVALILLSPSKVHNQQTFKNKWYISVGKHCSCVKSSTAGTPSLGVSNQLGNSPVLLMQISENIWMFKCSFFLISLVSISNLMLWKDVRRYDWQLEHISAAPPPDRYYTDSDSKWRHKIAELVRYCGIFWLHFYALGWSRSRLTYLCKWSSQRPGKITSVQFSDLYTYSISYFKEWRLVYFYICSPFYMN